MLEFDKAADIDVLAQFASDIWYEYWVEILSLEQIAYMVKKFQSAEAIKKQIADEKYVYYFIKQNGDNVGYIGLSAKPEYLFLSKLYVKKEFRHKGIGSDAFSFIKDYACAQGYKKIVLTVNKYNKNTISAYNKWGFKTVDSVITDIGNGFVMDDYIMEYLL